MKRCYESVDSSHVQPVIYYSDTQIQMLMYYSCYRDFEHKCIKTCLGFHILTPKGACEVLENGRKWHVKMYTLISVLKM